MKRWIMRGATAAMLLIVFAAVYGFAEARRDPVVRRVTVALPDWPAGAAPVRVALISDLHLGSPAMNAKRLARIADQITARRPDLVLIAGDFVFGHDPAKGERYASALVEPLARLRARLGTVAVLGNHDHWTAPAGVRRALAAAGVTLVTNGAVERGPLAVAGVDDAFTGHDQAGPALAAARQLPGAVVVVSHDPDLAPLLPAGTLLLAGHTHCGQVVLPWLGTMVVTSPLTGRRLFDPRYRCGVVHDQGGRTVIVTAGLGTSILPVRLGAPPDWWLLTLGPALRRSVNRPRS